MASEVDTLFWGVNLHTTWKINMEPTNHPLRKENDLPNLHDYVPYQNFRGVHLVKINGGT